MDKKGGLDGDDGPRGGMGQSGIEISGLGLRRNDTARPESDMIWSSSSDRVARSAHEIRGGSTVEDRANGSDQGEGRSERIMSMSASTYSDSDKDAGQGNGSNSGIGASLD